MIQDDRLAGFYTSLDARRWIAKAERYLVQRRCNVVVETTTRDDPDFAEKRGPSSGSTPSPRPAAP